MIYPWSCHSRKVAIEITSWCYTLITSYKWWSPICDILLSSKKRRSNLHPGLTLVYVMRSCLSYIKFTEKVMNVNKSFNL